MWFSTAQRISFDRETEKEHADMFEKMHPDWSKHIHGTSIAFTNGSWRRYEILKDSTDVPDILKALMPDIRVNEVFRFE